MRRAGQTLSTILDEMESLVAPGLSTAEIDALAARRCRELGVIPAFKGYHGFPASVCISVNEEVVHGIPSAKRILRAGDIVGIDFGIIQDRWFSDSARTVAVGEVAPEVMRLLKVTQESLERGIAACSPNAHLQDIGAAIQNWVEASGFSVVREFVGHGIGRALHEEPAVPNFGTPGRGSRLREGLVLAIEPMINAGAPMVRTLEDGWTVVTVDQSWSAHFEHTVAITSSGFEILTLSAPVVP